MNCLLPFKRKINKKNNRKTYLAPPIVATSTLETLPRGLVEILAYKSCYSTGFFKDLKRFLQDPDVLKVPVKILKDLAKALQRIHFKILVKIFIKLLMILNDPCKIFIKSKIFNLRSSCDPEDLQKVFEDPTIFHHRKPETKICSVKEYFISALGKKG